MSCTRLSVLAAVFMVSAFSGAGARAEDAPVRFSRPSALAAQFSPLLPPCQCRAQGRMYDLGETVCLNGQGAVTCALDQNVTSWKSTGGPCPQS